MAPHDDSVSPVGGAVERKADGSARGAATGCGGRRQGVTVDPCRLLSPSYYGLYLCLQGRQG